MTIVCQSVFNLLLTYYFYGQALGTLNNLAKILTDKTIVCVKFCFKCVCVECIVNTWTIFKSKLM